MEAVNARDQIGERPEHGALELKVFVKKNPKAGDINYGEIAHGNDKSRNMDIHDAITRSCYCHHEKLSMHSSEELDGRKLMVHLSAKDAVLTLAGVSPGSGVLHEEIFDGPSGSRILTKKCFVKNSGPRS